MRKIVLASHHKLAEGMCDTLQFLSGNCDSKVVCAYVDDSDVDEQIKEVMMIEAEETFIFTDMLGGSVTQKFMRYLNQDTHIICGMNLPLVLIFVLAQENKLSTLEIEQIIQEAKDGIVYMNTYKSIHMEEDE